MKRERPFLDKLSQDAGTEGLLPVHPIVELAGGNRLLIENHLGVIQYTTEKIGVNVSFGCIQVCGCGMQLIQMTKERLMISGRLDTVALIRRK